MMGAKEPSVVLLQGYGWGNYHIDMKRHKVKFDFEEGEGYEAHTYWHGYFLLPSDGSSGYRLKGCRCVARIDYSSDERTLTASLFDPEDNSVTCWTRYQVHGNWPRHTIVPVADSHWSKRVRFAS